MFQRALAAIAVAFVLLSAPLARAQDVARTQADLADLGVWMQEYQAVMNIANEPFIAVAGYLEALERFGDGSLSASRARRQIRVWQDDALASMARAREAAAALRTPPTLGQYGAEGAALDLVLRSIYQDVTPNLTETEAVVRAVANLGFAALDDRNKGYAARERAYYQASIHLIAVDRRRIDVAATSISRNHPTQALMIATQHYYDSLVAVPTYAIQEQDGAGDRGALIASLRVSARSMRAALSRARMLVEQLRTETQNTQAGPNVEISRVMLRMLESFPPSIAAYEGLATGIEEAADSLSAGSGVADVWADQETNDRPHLMEIARLEALRAQLLATNNHSPL